MAFATAKREIVNTELRRVAVCDTCSKEADIGPLETELFIEEFAPPSWLSVIEKQGKAPLLLFCSLECLQGYGHA